MAMNTVIGRKPEKIILANALKSNRPELIAVYGRRRVGKTYLVRNAYKNRITIEFTGMHDVPLKRQLKNFYLTLVSLAPDTQKPSDWIEAFHQLSGYFNTLKSAKKKVLFIDEFPWFDTRKSGFLPAFENFWNSYASKRNDLVVVICGSAASYMIKNIIKSKGGLHNRLTRHIRLAPFTLSETEQLFKYNRVNLSRYDILQLYMAMGGIPFYLEQVLPGESVAQTIDRLCFNKQGLLRTEFNNIFASLFDQHGRHEEIVRVLANVRKGITRTELLSKSKISTGGALTKAVLELEESGFVESYTPYKGKKDPLIRLTDEYSLFYLKYIEKIKPSHTGIWMKMQGLQPYKIWSGFSFETICIKHVSQILEGLKISGINTTYGSWIAKGVQNGAQIDLLIDRDDNVINVCEMKFYNTAFTLTKKYAHEVLNKVNAFVTGTKTKKSIFTTFITTFGLTPNNYSRQYVQNELTMDVLFTDL
jgi:predicted AAA+ superfamily ATPase